MSIQLPAPRGVVVSEIDTFLIYGECFRNRLRDMDITEVLTAPQCPWQNPSVEKLVGSIRCECLNHVIVPGEKHRRRILKSYAAYYLGSRTHLLFSQRRSDHSRRAGAGNWRGRRDPAGRCPSPSPRTAGCVTVERLGPLFSSLENCNLPRAGVGTCRGKGSTRSLASRTRDQARSDGPRLWVLDGCFCGKCITK
jgi:hypothetical protein